MADLSKDSLQGNDSGYESSDSAHSSNYDDPDETEADADAERREAIVTLWQIANELEHLVSNGSIVKEGQMQKACLTLDHANKAHERLLMNSSVSWAYEVVQMKEAYASCVRLSGK
jgi:hypothetical protein